MVEDGEADVCGFAAGSAWIFEAIDSCTKSETAVVSAGGGVLRPGLRATPSDAGEVRLCGVTNSKMSLCFPQCSSF